MVLDKTKTDSSIGLVVGAEAPDFTAPLVRPDGDTEAVALSALLEDAPVLLAFYTNDFSPDCVTEWCSFRDDAWFDAGKHVQVVGVSRSRPYTHRRFMEYLDLPFPLYSDTDLAITEAYQIWYRLFKILPRARRSCFLVDQERRIRYRWVAQHPLDPTRETPSMREIRTAIENELNASEFEFG
jgi:peroxiredoxin